MNILPWEVISKQQPKKEDMTEQNIKKLCINYDIR